jgi:hypothetical protein
MSSRREEPTISLSDLMRRLAGPLGPYWKPEFVIDFLVAESKILSALRDRKIVALGHFSDQATLSSKLGHLAGEGLYGSRPRTKTHSRLCLAEVQDRLALKFRKIRRRRISWRCPIGS